MKPIFMSWKDYAKELESKLARAKCRESFLAKYDTAINEYLLFPSVEVLIDYVKIKAEINKTMAEIVTYCGEEVTPTNVSKREFEIRNHANIFRDKLNGYIECNNVKRLTVDQYFNEVLDEK